MIFSSIEKMKSLHSFARSRIANAMKLLAGGAAAVLAWHFTVNPVSFLALETASAVLLLLAGGVASGSFVKSAVMALVCLALPASQFLMSDVFQVSNHAADPAGLQKFVQTFLPVFGYLLYVVPLLCAIVGVLRFAIAMVEARYLAEQLRELEGRSVRA
ncbi:hypothetical protein VWT76_15585 [Xanthomonas citri pv. citri]|uniref:hypothetical protein n=1 Tax=Xanthomonas citri TaxID=346 RepID=UPI000952DEAB|nr:hypothetical protein [Xanthomonas citri]MBD5034918.1 hypothetical protein [Xanthomonas citri pv. citri]MBD5054798.1 hypothetical protein [Xanthomonas citri pv. citri]OLR69826.1 hypothetical protein BI311_24270 [Xanthomonas citri pv. citri]